MCRTTVLPDRSPEIFQQIDKIIPINIISIWLFKNECKGSLMFFAHWIIVLLYSTIVKMVLGNQSLVSLPPFM